MHKYAIKIDVLYIYLIIFAALFSMSFKIFEN